MTLSARARVRANVIDGMDPGELRLFISKLEEAVDTGYTTHTDDDLDEWAAEIVDARDESLSPLGQNGDGS